MYTSNVSNCYITSIRTVKKNPQGIIDSGDSGEGTLRSNGVLRWKGEGGKTMSSGKNSCRLVLQGTSKRVFVTLKGLLMADWFTFSRK